MPIRVILADDHAVVRAGLRRLIEASPDIHVLAEAESGEQAFREYLAQRPDMAIFDLNMPGMGGLEALRRILAHDTAARILVLSMHEDIVYPARALQSAPPPPTYLDARRALSKQPPEQGA